MNHKKLNSLNKFIKMYYINCLMANLKKYKNYNVFSLDKKLLMILKILYYFYSYNKAFDF